MVNCNIRRYVTYKRRGEGPSGAGLKDNAVNTDVYYAKDCNLVNCNIETYITERTAGIEEPTVEQPNPKVRNLLWLLGIIGTFLGALVTILSNAQAIYTMLFG